MISRRRLHRRYAESGYSDAFFETLTERDMRRAGMVGWVARVGGGGGGSTKEKKVTQPRPVMFEIGMVEGDSIEKADQRTGPSTYGKGKGLVGMGQAWEGIKVSAQNPALDRSGFLCVATLPRSERQEHLKLLTLK